MDPSLEQTTDWLAMCCYRWTLGRLNTSPDAFCSVRERIWVCQTNRVKRQLMNYSSLISSCNCRSSAEGLGYVISFAIGATLVLILMWIIRFSYHLAREQSFVGAKNQLPGLHFQVMWLPGGIAGLLWSIGNISSMLSVVNLGEGVGYSIVQAQMLVAGLWGILYYREIRGARTIAAWFSCACVTIAGILFLSHEHVKSRH